jgi:hypothetical protein
MAKKVVKQPSKDNPTKKSKPAGGKKAPAATKATEKKPAVKKAPAKRKSRTAKVTRMKAFWGVFNQSLKRVALYEFNEKKEADKKAKDLTASGKSPHFVQPVREPVTE